MSEVKISKQVPLGVAFATIHTAHFQRHLTVKNIHIANTAAVDVTVQVTLTPEGVAPQQSAGLLWDFIVPGNDFIEFGEGIIIVPSASLSALAGAIDSAVLFLSGIED